MRSNIIYKKVDKHNLILFILNSILLMLTPHLYAQMQPDRSTAYTIYKLANSIGTEECVVSASSSLKTYSIQYRFNDRGIKRALNSTFKIDENGQPLYFSSAGFSSRWVNEHTDVTITNQKNEYTFPIATFAPATMQQLLIHYWKQNKQPAIITSLPNHLSIAIQQEGYDTVMFLGNKTILERLQIAGLIWGNEWAWMNENGELIFLSTNDTEGDKTEIINKEYESLFASLLSLSTTYAINAATKEYPVAATAYTDIAIVGGNMINVTGKDTVTNNSLVIIHNNKIEYVGLMNTSKIPATAFVIDAHGKYLLPGLWDMHAHLFQTEWLPKYLAAGVTTVRDCGNEFNFINTLQRAVDEQIIRGPKVIKAGLIDGTGKTALGAIQVNSKSDAIKLVAQYKDSGFAQIKIYSSVKLPVLKAICTEAHRLNLTITGHVPEGITATSAINAGMDMISHVSFFRNSILTSNGLLDYNDKRTKDFVYLLQSKNIVVDPTLSVYENTDSSFIRNMVFYKTVTSELQKTGVPIIAGTDMSEGGVAKELALYVEAGFTPLQAIQSATIIPAQVMKMDIVSGSIEAGKNADIILLDSDPLKDISNLKHINAVIQGSHIYEIKTQPEHQ